MGISRTRLFQIALLSCALTGIGSDVEAQNAERDSVLATVQKVFDGMRTRDTALLKSAFDTSARLGTVAQVWTYYTFHLNDTFSHCGIDAFMLVKVGNSWKITQLADTERKDCTK